MVSQVCPLHIFAKNQYCSTKMCSLSTMLRIIITTQKEPESCMDTGYLIIEAGQSSNVGNARLCIQLFLTLSCCHKLGQEKMAEDKDQLLPTNKHSLAQLICVSL